MSRGPFYQIKISTRTGSGVENGRQSVQTVCGGGRRGRGDWVKTERELERKNEMKIEIRIHVEKEFVNWKKI